LLAQASAGPVDRWELKLVVDGKPHTLLFHAQPIDQDIVLVGNFVPTDYEALVEQLNASFTELATLSREGERQRREIERRRDENVRLTSVLDDSDRGMVALHAEIAEKTDSLARAGAVKSRMVANVSHEFRTPLNSIIGLSRLLLAKTDGALTQEQEKQIGFILKSADTLSELVNDLLDLSKLEAGKVGLRADRFKLAELFAAARGMLRPLAMNPEVQLVFENVPESLTLETDEGKVSQILRNLVSNALKFTDQGEVRVSARTTDRGRVEVEVRDTGIGIAPENLSRVFEEFSQIDSHLQRKSKGTGLGLSLSRRLAEFLGGTLTVQSRLGEGSTFTLSIPTTHPEVAALGEMVERAKLVDPSRSPILVLEDDRQTLFLYEKYLQGSGFQVIPARSIEDARGVLRRVRPAAIVLDVMLEGETSWTFLDEVKTDEQTKDIPVLVVTVMDREQKARALGADEFHVKPLDQRWLLNRLQSFASRGPVTKVLIIDDDEVARYILRRFLDGTNYTVIEASDGTSGVRLAREETPGAIILDFLLQETTAFEVLDALKVDPITRQIPVIIHTSKTLDPEERARLSVDTTAILSKHNLSRELAITRIREALEKAGLGAHVKERKGV
jgi:signal transduction histidine kinase/CheY-like chemotaxis protein